MSEAAPQRTHSLREVFNGLHYLVRGGISWRMLPNDLPPWPVVYQQTQRWIAAGVFETMVHDLRVLIRVAADRPRQPSAAIFDARTVQSTAESGARAGYDGHKRRTGSKTHLAVDTLGMLLAVVVTAASTSDAAGARLVGPRLGGASKKLRKVWVDGTYRGRLARWVVEQLWFRLHPVLRNDGQRGFVVLPKRWIVGPTFAWLTQCRRLSKDYEVLPARSEAMIYIAVTRLMVRRLAHA